MLFQRRTKLSFLVQARELLWPRAGWLRAFRYFAHRIGRIKAGPHAIASGFAAGVAVSFLPVVGLHFLLAAILALVTRGSVVASAIGTLIGNPWTFPLIWLATFDVGVRLLPEYVDQPVRTEAFVRAMAELVSSALTFDSALMRAKVWPLWFPMMVGGIALAIPAWLASYGMIRWLLQLRSTAQRQDAPNDRTPLRRGASSRL